MSEKDLLISRIVDRVDRPEDWERWREIAAADPRLCHTLVETLREESSLRLALEPDLVAVDAVELPAPGFLVRHPGLVSWSGWLATAGLALLWLAFGGQASTPGALSPAPRDGSERIAQDTRGGAAVLRELPNVMVETRPIPGSERVEVVYVRRVLERTIVDGLYTMAHDEVGQPIRARADLTRYVPRRNY